MSEIMFETVSSSRKVAVLSASWHVPIVESAEKGFLDEMVARGFNENDIDIIKVPGALEVPLAGKLALENGYGAVVGIAFVVDGGIYRHEFVAHTALQSMLDVSRELCKPFISVVISPQKFREGNAEDEAWFVDHMYGKGKEAAEACSRMLEVVSGF